MNQSVNINDARKLFEAEIKHVSSTSWSPCSDHHKLIKDVILGSHLTFRYILTTAILAKNINNLIEPLALQVGSELDGAYDARSVCHKVVVPVERALLGGRLGESNEPFLNKPARFKELSIHNAVRKGKDLNSLKMVIHILSHLDDKNSLNSLRDAIFYILLRDSRDVGALLSQNTDKNRIDAYEFFTRFSSRSFEGETCAVVTGAALSIIVGLSHNDTRVFVHPVNQSGASSKEIADVDIYNSGGPLLCAEVKDKAFTIEDVEHAVKKAIVNKVFSLMFVIGPNGGSPVKFSELERFWRERGFFLTFIDIEKLVSASLVFGDDKRGEEFINNTAQFCKMARVKDEVFSHLHECLKN